MNLNNSYRLITLFVRTIFNWGFNVQYVRTWWRMAQQNVQYRINFKNHSYTHTRYRKFNLHINDSAWFQIQRCHFVTYAYVYITFCIKHTYYIIYQNRCIFKKLNKKISIIQREKTQSITEIKIISISINETKKMAERV